jgi:Carboxypeptidase regulatory-like domain
MKRAITLAVLFALVCMWASPAGAQSQAINGTIEGTIKDASGGVLPGVTVTLTNTDTGATRVVVTGPTGVFRAPLLPLGTYKIEVVLSGFSKLQRTGVRLSAGQIVVLNETLSVGASETVTVTAETPVVDLGKVDVGRNISDAELRNLPNVSRNPYNFALLEPGVTGFENSEFGVPRFAVNGQMLRINYQIDGSTNTQKDRAGLRLMPMSEVMIREVQVVSSGYAPEFGQATGMVYNAVTPSGTNVHSGDIGYRFRTKKWSAFPAYFVPAKIEANRPDNSFDIFTTTIGGPILRNKMHYYFGIEYDYNNIQQDLTIDPTIAAQVGVGLQPANTGSYRRVTQPIWKVDWAATSAHRVSFRVNTFTNDNPFNASGGGNNAIERAIDFEDAMVSASTQVISTLGNSRLNELRVQYAQRHQTRFPHDPSVTGVTVNIAGGTVNGVNNNINFGRPSGQSGQDFTQRITEVTDNLTWLNGNHNYKTGFNVQWVDDHRGVPLVHQYTFPSVQAYLDARSGVNTRSYTTFTQTMGNPNLDFSNALVAAFVQDDWKVRSNLKVLYGVRYDYYLYPAGIPAAADGTPAPYNATFPRDKNNLAPRAGFAWTMDRSQQTVLRGSSGLNYDQPLLATVETAYTASGLVNRTASVNLGPTGTGAPDFPNTLSNVQQTATTLQGVAPDYVTARTWQNTLTLDRQLGKNYSASIGVRYTKGYDLPVITDVNLAGVAPVSRLADGRGVYSATVSGTTRVDPRYNRVQLVQSIGESWYRGVTLQFSKRMTRGTQWNLNYSYARGVDTAPLGGGTLAVQGDAVRSDPADLTRDKGVNQLDQRHTFNGSIVAMSTVTRFSPLVNRILSDNQVGVVLQFGSGLPLTVTGNADLNLDGVNNDRVLWEPRNSVNLPARWNVDLRYSRFYTISGNLRASVQAEFKNIFNNEQMAGVSTQTFVNAAGHQLVSAGGALKDDQRISRDINTYATLNPASRNGYEQRKFQLGFKFLF